MNLSKAMPEFCEEVRTLLLRINRNDLASQLKTLEIERRCPCTDFGCASFKVSGTSTPDAFEMPGERRSTYTRSLDIKADSGKIVLALDQLGRITAFEVTNRPDVRKKLLRAR